MTHVQRNPFWSLDPTLTCRHFNYDFYLLSYEIFHLGYAIQTDAQNYQTNELAISRTNALLPFCPWCRWVVEIHDQMQWCNFYLWHRLVVAKVMGQKSFLWPVPQSPIMVKWWTRRTLPSDQAQRSCSIVAYDLDVSISRSWIEKRPFSRCHLYPCSNRRHILNTRNEK